MHYATIQDMARAGGKARAAKLTPARRLEIAKRASKAAGIAREKKVLAGKVKPVTLRA